MINAYGSRILEGYGMPQHSVLGAHEMLNNEHYHMNEVSKYLTSNCRELSGQLAVTCNSSISNTRYA
jgi:hypothetical protein